MLAILCPGQGAQAPGMLAPWLDHPGNAALLEQYSQAAGLDLRHLGTEADAETIRDTRVTQPLLTVAALLSFGALIGAPDHTTAGSHGGPEVNARLHTVFAGHSVGEIAAAALSGVLTDTDALRLVAERGRAMADAAAARPTGMAAVLGGDHEEVAEALARHGLTAANVNGGSQVVAAGTAEQVEALAGDPPARTRVVPLQVAGAFHTDHMAPAVERVRSVADTLDPADPGLLYGGVQLLSNRDGAAVASGQDALDRIVAQVASPVRWDLCCQTLLDLGVTGAVELAPGGVLTGLARRTLRGVETVALKGPEDVDAARDLIARHGAAA